MIFNSHFSKLKSWYSELHEKYLDDSYKRRCSIGLIKFHLIKKLFGVKYAFFDLHPIHYGFSKPYIDNLTTETNVILVVSSKNHPALSQKNRNLFVILIENINWFFQADLRIRNLLTAASHIHESSRPLGTNLIHIYHSMVSMHVVYGDDAFDSYTHFFACGPHHVKEIDAICKLRKLKKPTVFEVGYPKIDALAEQYDQYLKDRDSRGSLSQDDCTTISFSPSWHEDNLLKAHAEEIVRTIFSIKYVKKLFIRPHPLTFDHDEKTMDTLKALALEFDGLTIEDSRTSNQSFFESDFLISDWSGVAFEYAFATERPVLFIDSPRKINTKCWKEYPLPSIEDEARSIVGTVIPNHLAIEEGIEALKAPGKDFWRKKIAVARLNYLFNFKNSAKVGAQILLTDQEFR
ncbi:CDP-glycerol glycerophosphotransferase family protein [Bdellovibrio sp.]|uniref:CDP-glycerol glycerophosphotransferase family protein n=1 Tax=Bdellovibrio sp. TaxID=28201 RepID=UPI0039E5B6D4